jgi:hypothetical protein
MKKFLTTILAVLYLATSLGATIHLHYCMGKIVSWGFLNHESRNCAYCGMPKMTGKEGQFSKKNCCKDDQKEIKTGGDQQWAQSEFEFPQYATNPLPSEDFFYLVSLNVFTGSRPATHSPPFLKRPAFLLHRNFRI